MALRLPLAGLHRRAGAAPKGARHDQANLDRRASDGLRRPHDDGPRQWATRAGAGDAPGEMAPNEFGVAESVHRSRLIDRSNPFFLELGVNGRTRDTSSAQ